MKMLTRLGLCLLLIAPGISAMAAKKLKLNEKEKAFLTLVDLIITLEERKIFRKKLTSHHERTRFMELFWAKRDPDLTNNVNEFYQEWMARYDYVITHFKDERFRQTAMNKTELFMLLGPPTRKSRLVDLTLMGPGYRNRYTRYPPELWVYEDVGFDYKRKQLKVQFIATSAFGEYVAITDRLTDHFLRVVKFRFIVNPELEEAPLNALTSTDYQDDVLELAGNTDEEQIDDLAEASVPVGAPPSEAPEVVTIAADDAEPEISTETTATPAAPPEPEVTVADNTGDIYKAPPKKADRPKPPTQEEDIYKAPPKRAETRTVASGESPPTTLAPPPKATPKETNLAVPSTTSVSVARDIDSNYQTGSGNQLGLRSRTTWFKSGSDRRLLLGRVGFPLASLDFHYIKNQYQAPFQMDYSLIDSNGKTVHRDSIRTEILLPSKRILKKKNTFYSKEFAVILNGDRFTLKTQLQDLNTNQISYHEQVVEIPPLRAEPHATDLVLMDPNVNPDFARFNIKGKPYNLRLTKAFNTGERIYPVTELVNITSEDQISTIEIQALQGDNEDVVHTWDLYSGEMTNTNQGSFMLHPVLNTKPLDQGDYLLRFEIELSSGEILFSQTELTVE